MNVSTDHKSKQRVSTIREAQINQFAATHNVRVQEGPKTMAQQTQPQKTAPAKPQTPPPAAPAAKTNGAASADATKGDKPAKTKRAKLRWVSTKDGSFWVRSFKDVTDKHGAPKDPWGVEMVVKAGQAFGKKLTDEEKAARATQKEAEKKRKESMSDEERLAEAKAKRETKQKSKQEAVEKNRADILAQLLADMEAGKIPGYTLTKK